MDTYYSKNKYKRQEYQKEYNANNRDKILAKNRERYKLNRDSNRARAKKWNESEKGKESHKKHREANREKLCLRSRLANYGLTYKKYVEMFDRQGGACAICKMELPKKFCIDHSHESGAVRGILCYRCNILIGVAQENVSILSHAIEYLSPN